MKLSTKILIAIAILLIVIQFFRPAKNNTPPLISDNDISKRYTISEQVHTIFIQKCYDCHSNNTRYPWYDNIQPVAWWMASHVKEGKEELNFSEFKTYSEKKAAHKLENISKSVTEGWMPLDSYLWIHTDSKITPQETEFINAWIKSLGIEFEKDENSHAEE